MAHVYVHRKKNLMLERGMTAKQAQMQILREQQMHAFPESMRPAQWIGGVGLSKMSAVNALNGGDVPRRSLDELIMIRKALIAGQQAEAMNRMAGAQGVAVAGRPN